MKYTWEKSKETEHWMYGDFETIEECMNDAKTNYGYSSGDSIAIGTIEPYEITVSGIDFLDMLEENAYEECGESAEGWNPSRTVKQENIEELSLLLTATTRNWLEKQHELPDISRFTNIEMVVIT